MNFLVIDGNSILNRAFYGIKVLTTKDGRFTNAIYGIRVDRFEIRLILSRLVSNPAVGVFFPLYRRTEGASRMSADPRRWRWHSM